MNEGNIPQLKLGYSALSGTGADVEIETTREGNVIGGLRLLSSLLIIHRHYHEGEWLEEERREKTEEREREREEKRKKKPRRVSVGVRERERDFQR